MSYLDGPRITFAGRFLADVPTVNNSPGSYGPSGPPPSGLGWNPAGGGTFDLLGCQVDGGEGADATPIAPNDPLIGVAVTGAGDRASAKLVDLDPGWQFSSQIWGFGVRLLDSAGTQLLAGSFRPAAFRDLWSLDIGGRASFTSVLDDVVFGQASANSAVLDALREASPTSRLSIVINTFAFGAGGDGRGTSGKVSGCIGVWRPGEPLSFLGGRRLQMGMLNSGAPTGPAVAVLAGDPPRLVIDLGNACPFTDPVGTPDPSMAGLEVGVLPTESVEAGAILPADPAPIVIGRTGITAETPPAAIITFPLESTAVKALEKQSIALFETLADGRRQVVARETRNGTYVRADDFVHRMEAGATTTVELHAYRRGVPVRQTVHLVARGSLLSVPDHVTTESDGAATVTVRAGDPGKARGPIDGAVGSVAYSTALGADGAPDYVGSGLDVMFDVIVARVFDRYPAPAEPDLETAVHEVLSQYARLYPVMSNHLVDLGSPGDVAAWRQPMLLALSRDIGDPNHMPVTRDLSDGKRAAIRRWLEQLPPSPGGMTRRRSADLAPPAVAGTDSRPVVEFGAEDDRDAKRGAARDVTERAMAQLRTAETRPDQPQG